MQRLSFRFHFILLLFYALQEKFVLSNYMPKQPSLNSEMRAILIDWLVEVQVRGAGSLCGWKFVLIIDFKVSG